MLKLAAKKTPSKPASKRLSVAKAVAPVVPEVTRVAVKKTRTATISGSLSAYQQSLSILSNSRSFGEAIDQFSRLEATARTELVSAITEELKSRRIKTELFNIGTESTPEGVFIVLTKNPA